MPYLLFLVYLFHGSVADEMNYAAPALFRVLYVTTVSQWDRHGGWKTLLLGHILSLQQQ